VKPKIAKIYREVELRTSQIVMIYQNCLNVCSNGFLSIQGITSVNLKLTTERKGMEV
jgi:hypothetical protein